MTRVVAIVDDDEAILDSVAMVLDGYGWRVETYASGEEYLEDVKGNDPDCVILDPHLAGISGAQLARSILDTNTDIPIIVLTARPDSPATTELIRAGARTILTKPTTAKELVDQVSAVLQSSDEGN